MEHGPTREFGYPSDHRRAYAKAHAHNWELFSADYAWDYYVCRGCPASMRVHTKE